MNKKLVIIAQRVDEEDDIVGFFISWIEEFAKHFDQVTVITQKEGVHRLPQNVLVLSMGKEKGYSKLHQLARLYKYLVRELNDSQGVFVHMSPIFAVLAWPITFIYQKKIILWYLHRAVSWKLRLARYICSRIVTASKESLNIKSKKIVELGHGIDLAKFSYSGHELHHPLRILSIGRISPIKDYETLLQAIALLKEKGISVRTIIIGRPVYASDIEYFHKLKNKVAELNIKDSVDFIGHVPYKDIDSYYKNSDVTVNLTPPGGLDKAVLESMATGIVPFTSNTVFKKLLSPYDFLIFKHGDPLDLVQSIESFFAQSDKRSIQHNLTQKIKDHHNLPVLIDKISHLL